MHFDELKLLPGTRVKLVIAGGGPAQNPLSCKYMGSHAPHSLLVAVSDHLPAINLRVGARVVASLANPTGIVTFSSLVQAVNLEPFMYVHLAYPEAMQIRNVRSAVRVDVEVLAQATNLFSDDHLEAHPARILDMSVNGMKLGSAVLLGDIGDELAVHVQLVFDDIAREILLTGVIRTRLVAQQSVDNCAYTYGIEFTQLDEDKRVLLYAFVFNRVQRYGPQI
jgi:hypothetical protein